MADRTISVLFKGNVTGLVNSFKAADKAASDWGNSLLKKIDKNSGQINTLSRSVGIMGAGLAGFAALAVKSFAEFDNAMAQVGAATMETAGNMEALREAALQAGRDTAFSATEAADGIEQLAKAGVSTADILSGGLSGALDLAASDNLAVGDAAEIAATALTQFKLAGSDVSHVADLLAAGAAKAQGGVADLGNALKQGGLVASATGLTIEETAGGLSAFASAGLLGSDAGTSFKSMLQRLTPQSKEAQKKMDELGISAYDAQGNFIGLANFAGNLQDAMKDLTPEQRNAAQAIIFGSDAVRASNILYEQGKDGIQGWIDAVDQSGFASEQASMRLDSLTGDLKILKGSLETAFIGIGEGANGPLRSLVQGITDAVNKFAEMPSWVQQATLALTGGGGLVLLGIAGLGKLAVATQETLAALVQMNIISQATAGRFTALAVSAAKMAGAAAGVLVLAAGVGKLVDALNRGEAVPNAEKLQESLTALADTGDIANLDDAFGNFGETLGMATVDVDGFGDAIKQAVHPSFTDQLASWGDNLPGVTGYMERLEERFTNLDGALAAMVEGGNLQDAYMAFQEVKKSAEEQGVSMDELRARFPEYVAAVQAATSETESATPAQDEYNAAVQDGTASADQYTDALTEMVDQLTEATNIALKGRDANRDYEASLDDAADALKENGATLDITTEKGRANQDALDGIVDSGLAVIGSQKDLGASQGELQGIMQKTRDDFVDMAQKMGMSKEDADALADSLNLIPSSVTTTVTADTSSAEAVVSNWLGRWQNTTLNIRTNLSTSGANAQIQDLQRRSGNLVQQAEGGVVSYYADGGENHTAQIAPAGSWRVWAEPETGGEAYIPLALSKRSKSEDILSSVANQFGGVFQKFDSGGFSSRQYTAASAPSGHVSSTAGSGAGASFFAGAQITAADPQAAMKELRAVIRQEMAGRVF